MKAAFLVAWSISTRMIGVTGRFPWFVLICLVLFYCLVFQVDSRVEEQQQQEEEEEWTIVDHHTWGSPDNPPEGHLKSRKSSSHSPPGSPLATPPPGPTSHSSHPVDIGFTPVGGQDVPTGFLFTHSHYGSSSWPTAGPGHGSSSSSSTTNTPSYLSSQGSRKRQRESFPIKPPTFN